MLERLINEMTGAEIRDYLVSGKSSATDFYNRLLSFVEQGDQKIHAFANLDQDVVRLHAKHLDESRALGRAPGRLYGVPVGIKDIIETADYPTEYGSPIYKGRYSAGDATVVRRLRAADAAIFGKTATTEFAAFTPAATCNPHNIEHTPGGSSSGSAAAVAAGFVPVAIGSQTNGSVIRPASFCGVYGFKPSRGLIPTTGVLEQSPSLDQLGVFARNIEDIALVTEIINGDDGLTDQTKGNAPIRMVDICSSEPPVQPKLCFFKTPWWSKIDPEAQEAYEALIDHLGSSVVSVLEMPDVVDKVIQWQRTVQYTEMAFAYQREYLNHPGQLSDRLKEQITAGMANSAMDYLAAKDRIPHVASAFDEYFEHFDAILCPAALGTAPKGLASTGDPLMQTIWTFAGLPVINLPMLTLSNGLPLGVQAVGAYKDDARLLRTSRWLMQEFTS
jgi:Asp-tRNA(Asn)/Glu-tRNA(Gln) amidotransferase A subunit family amidase